MGWAWPEFANGAPISEVLLLAVILLRLLREIETCNMESHSTDIRQYHDHFTMRREHTEDIQPPPVTCPATTICVDNLGAMKPTNNQQFHKCTKRIDICYHFVRDTLAAGKISLGYLPMADMVADILMKPLPGDKYYLGKSLCIYFLDLLGWIAGSVA